MLKADCQRSVPLGIDNIIIDVLLKKVKNGKEKLFLACVMEGSSLIYIDNVNIKLTMGQQTLKDLHFIVRIIIGIFILLDPNKAVEDWRASKFVQTVDINTVLK